MRFQNIMVGQARKDIPTGKERNRKEEINDRSWTSPKHKCCGRIFFDSVICPWSPLGQRSPSGHTGVEAPSSQLYWANGLQGSRQPCLVLLGAAHTRALLCWNRTLVALPVYGLEDRTTPMAPLGIDSMGTVWSGPTLKAALFLGTDVLQHFLSKQGGGSHSHSFAGGSRGIIQCIICEFGSGK